MKHSLIKLTLACICLAVFSVVISGWSVAAIDPETCMGAWLFDNVGEEIEDDITENENHGTIKGNPDWDNGKFGMALVCDGADDVVDCGDKDTLDVGQDNFSIVVWNSTIPRPDMDTCLESGGVSIPETWVNRFSYWDWETAPVYISLVRHLSTTIPGTIWP